VERSTFVFWCCVGVACSDFSLGALHMVEVWSCGGGTQSGAIATLIKLGRLPRPDFAFMTDTGRERSSTWPFVDGFIRPQLAKVGLELQVIKASDFGGGSLFGGEDGKTVLMPGFTNLSGQVGKFSAFCSGNWKVRVGERFMQRACGIKKARNWIGISVEEMRRVRKQFRPWMELWYPLIQGVPMSRSQCVELIRSHWDGHIPHSACYMCPNMGNAEWIDMKLNWPGDFAAACAVEAEVRAVDPHWFCHPSCVPLAEVDFFAQTTMFPERGCTSGCFT
jgi:hypothetical protein